MNHFRHQKIEQIKVLINNEKKLEEEVMKQFRIADSDRSNGLNINEVWDLLLKLMIEYQIPQKYHPKEPKELQEFIHLSNENYDNVIDMKELKQMLREIFINLKEILEEDEDCYNTYN